MFHLLVGDIAYPERKYMDAAQAGQGKPGASHKIAIPSPKSPFWAGVKCAVKRMASQGVPVTAGALLGIVISLENDVILNHGGYLPMLALGLSALYH